MENLAGQVEAMQDKVDAMGETLAQLVAGSAAETVPATKGGVDRTMTIGERRLLQNGKLFVAASLASC